MVPHSSEEPDVRLFDVFGTDLVPHYLEGTPTTQMALEAGMPSLDVRVQVVDNMTGRSNVRNLARAFANGFRGIGALLSTQRNSRVHLGATIAVVALGLWVGIGPSDWALLSIAIAAVWIGRGIQYGVGVSVGRGLSR